LGGRGELRRLDFQVVISDLKVEQRRFRCVRSGGEEMGKESGDAKGVADVRRVGGGGSKCKTREGKV
jgi:hypothetical protein